jgi:hypothetical protein
VRVKNRHGELPLHMACRHNASIEVLRELVKVHPGTATIRTKEGKTPIHTMWEARDTTENKENYSSVFWQKIHVILETIAWQRQEVDRHPDTTCWLVVHAAVSFSDCPDTVLRYVLDRHPEQLQIRDNTGRLPLHIAVAARPGKLTASPQFMKCRRSGAVTVLEKQGLLPASLTTPELGGGANLQHPGPSAKHSAVLHLSVIALLLQKYPHAAREHDPNERHATRFPIHTAVLHQHTWHGGVRELFECAPEAMHVVDSVQGLYLFQMAAAPMMMMGGHSSIRCGDDSVDLDSIYHLLRAEPAALEDTVRTARQAEMDWANHKIVPTQNRHEYEVDSKNSPIFKKKQQETELHKKSDRCRRAFRFRAAHHRDDAPLHEQLPPERFTAWSYSDDDSLQKVDEELDLKDTSCDIWSRCRNGAIRFPKNINGTYNNKQDACCYRQSYERQESWDYGRASQSNAKVSSLLTAFGGQPRDDNAAP